MIDLHAAVDDADDHGGAAARAHPRTLDPEPLESGAEAARRSRPCHKTLVMNGSLARTCRFVRYLQRPAP
jgi:hypothetical protein